MACGSYLVVIFVHAGVVPLQDELLLEVHVPLILDVLGEPLLRAAGEEHGCQGLEEA